MTSAAAQPGFDPIPDSRPIAGEGDRAPEFDHQFESRLDDRLDPRDGVMEPIESSGALDRVPRGAEAAGVRPDRQSLTHRTAAGLAWLLAQAIGSKVIGFGSQLILAGILIPEQFGVYTFALSLATIINVLQHSGVGEILVHRQRRVDLWVNPAMWLSTAMGLGATLLILAAVPIAAHIRPNQPLLGTVIAIISLSALLSALCIVPTALLQIRMRQRAIGLINLGSTVIGAAVSVVLAWKAEAWGAPKLGGPVALALGAIASTLWQAIALWVVARPRLLPRLQLGRWRYMIADSLKLLASGIINDVTRQGATMVLGVLHSVHVVGLFSFGFLLSLQSVALLQTSLNAVLFPALSKLQGEPVRLLRAYVRSCRLLAILGMPACFLQAAAAEPVMRLLFDDRWLDALPVVQWLSVGMAFALLGSINSSLIKAQGRFDLLVKITIAYGLSYVGIVAVGGVLGDHRAMAVAVTVYLVTWGPVGTYISARTVGGTIVDVFRIYGGPGLMAACSVGIGYLAGQQLTPATKLDYAVQAFVMAGVAGIVHLLITRMVAKDSLLELMERLDAIAPVSVGRVARRALVL